jgi:hypothetical protein
MEKFKLGTDKRGFLEIYAKNHLQALSKGGDKYLKQNPLDIDLSLDQSQVKGRCRIVQLFHWSDPNCTGYKKWFLVGTYMLRPSTMEHWNFVNLPLAERMFTVKEEVSDYINLMFRDDIQKRSRSKRPVS